MSNKLLNRIFKSLFRLACKKMAFGRHGPTIENHTFVKVCRRVRKTIQCIKSTADLMALNTSQPELSLRVGICGLLCLGSKLVFTRVRGLA